MLCCRLNFLPDLLCFKYCHNNCSASVAVISQFLPYFFQRIFIMNLNCQIHFLLFFQFPLLIFKEGAGGWSIRYISF